MIIMKTSSPRAASRKKGEKLVEEEPAINPDFPEESEAAEYRYFPTQMHSFSQDLRTSILSKWKTFLLSSRP